MWLEPYTDTEPTFFACLIKQFQVKNEQLTAAVTLYNYSDDTG